MIVIPALFLKFGRAEAHASSRKIPTGATWQQLEI
jgi:hypothetical protein